MEALQALGDGVGGLALAQLAIGVLGVLVITSEYSTGSIQTSLASAGQRPQLCVR
jgi:hypothetical protein